MPDLFTTAEAARYIRLSIRTLERYRQHRSGPEYIRLGRRVLYDRQELKLWADLNRQL